MKKRKNEILEILTKQDIPEDLKTKQQKPCPNPGAAKILKLLGWAMAVGLTRAFTKIFFRCEQGFQYVLTLYFFGIVIFAAYGIILSIADHMEL